MCVSELLSSGFLLLGSEDGQNWGSPVAIGTYLDDATLKNTIFTPRSGRYVKVISLSEAGGRDSSTSIAELNVYEGTALPPSPATAGSWGLTIDFPVIPVSAAIEWSSGRLLVWSSFSPRDFVGASGHQTATAIYDPATQLVSSRTITNTDHDMFCEGLSMDSNGRIVAVGGNSDYGTSIYDSTSDSWTTGGVSPYLSYAQYDGSKAQIRIIALDQLRNLTISVLTLGSRG